MRRFLWPWTAWMLAGLWICALPACKSGSTKPDQGVANAEEQGTAGVEPSVALTSEIPPDQMEPTLAAHYAGLGHMERFEYKDAATAFRKVRELAPGWIPGSVNLAIALLNQTGEQIEEAGGRGGATGQTNFDEALDLLDAVLAREPENLHAHYCKAIILEQVGEWSRAHEHFKRVTEGDPTNGHAWFWYGVTLPAPGGERQASIQEADLLIAAYEKALEFNPYLVPAIYRLSQAYGWAGQREKQMELLQRKDRLDPERRQSPPGPGDTAAKVYGSMGRYAEVMGPTRERKPPSGEVRPPGLDAFQPLEVTLLDGTRWARADDFQGDTLAVIARGRAMLGGGIAAFDANGDQKLDLYLTAAVVGPEGVRDVLLLNRGEGRFEDATETAGLPMNRAGLGVAVGDFDADRNLDLYLTGVGDQRLFRGLGEGKFEDLTESTGLGNPGMISPTARWLDLDQDGDLDLYVLNHATVEQGAASAFTNSGGTGAVNAAFRNDGKAAPAAGPELTWAPLATESQETNSTGGLSIAFTPWPDAEALIGPAVPTTGIAALDLDDDRDLDLVLAAPGQPLYVVWNERLGRFQGEEFKDTPVAQGGSLLVGDFDRDDRSDLLLTASSGAVQAWHNLPIGTGGPRRAKLAAWPLNAQRWTSATVADLDLDGWVDVAGVATDEPWPLWAHNEGDRLVTTALPATPEAGETSNPIGLAYADLVGDALPDLVLVRDGQQPSIARNQGNGRNWLAIDLGGRWGVSPKLMRTNPQALGTKLALEGAGLSVPNEHTTTQAGTAQSVAPFAIGLGDSENVPLVRVRWPDGVMQCEMNETANQLLQLAEYNRKTGSCPVLFTWNGERFVCLGDFLGGGGLGYLVAPGEYSQPDRDEALAISPEQLQPARGVYRISITEPMDEVAYLDHLMLEVIDRPADVSVHPDERFAPGGNRPSGERLAWKTRIEPERATDLQGQDVTESLREWDRDTVDTFRRLPQWIGYTEEHGVVLDFGDQLAGFKPDDELILCTAGWVEYPYSQTNYAASTAGIALQPPVLERLQEDGSWAVIEADPGYPAGLPRMTTLDVTGKLVGPRCTIRLRTNMECYYDQVFVAVRDRDAEAALHVEHLPVARASIGNRGYTREISPDGRLPLVYDYDYVDPAPLAPFSGRLTRYGDVTPLLQADDDQHCVVGPGDEVKVEFIAEGLPDLPEGWTRSFILRTYGYCKDADPFTAGSDQVEPLPWRDMPPYPFPIGTERPLDPEYEAYLKTYQTRSAGRAY